MCLLQTLYKDVQNGVDVVRRNEDNVEVFDVRVALGRADEVVVVLDVRYVERLGLQEGLGLIAAPVEMEQSAHASQLFAHQTYLVHSARTPANCLA